MALRIYLKNEIGVSCASIDDGNKFLQLISPELAKGSTIEVDFEGVKQVLTPFLNASFGKLLQHFGKDQTMALVNIRNVSDSISHRGVVGLTRVSKIWIWMKKNLG